jgi:hypothetical protein
LKAGKIAVAFIQTASRKTVVPQRRRELLAKQMTDFPKKTSEIGFGRFEIGR